MKKRIQVLLSLAVVIIMAVSFSACGNSTGPNGNASSEATSSEASSSEAVSSAASSEASSEKDVSSSASSDTVAAQYSSIEEFVNSADMQSQLSSIKSSIESQGLKMDVSGKDNKLIYTYQYTKDVKVSANALNSALDAQTSTFQNVAASLKGAVKVDNPVVVVRYLDKGGKEITSKEFSAK